jgi:hypothetical protein
MPHFYNPNQPRILKGHEGGGQWTDEDVHLARQPAPPPRPAPAHPRVMLPSPRILPPPGPAAPPSFESTGPLPFSFEALEPPLRAAADMYERLSARDTAEKRAVATFRARGFFFGDPTGVQVSVLNVDEVKAVCKKFDDVQSKLDQADVEAPLTRPNFNEAQRGTAIHQLVAKEINGHSDSDRPPKDPKFRAETSVVKTLEALDQQTLSEKLVNQDYGKPGTTRFDVLEFPGDTTDTVCVYDIKTADALLRFNRMGHFAELLSRYGNKLIVVVQVKPSFMYRK